MSDSEKYCARLREAVEKFSGKQICSHGDFTELADIIFEKNKAMISSTTLKRFWGYLKNESTKPQIHTLNVLSQLVGHQDWKTFCKYIDNQNDYTSEFIELSSLHAFLMKLGQKIKVTWYPERSVVLRYEGDGDLFTVLESHNSKLEPGMTAHCTQFVSGNILHLSNVKGGSLETPCDYICGKVNGIEFELLN